MTNTLANKRIKAKKVAERLPFYSFKKIRSYNAIYNIVVGGRGLGKTFGKKEDVILDFLRTGAEFIYLRRYKSELVASKATFFADVSVKFPDYQFRINGFVAQIAPRKADSNGKSEWRNIGYFIALSMGQSQKGGSFANVKTIIFDEFIIEKGTTHYLPDEVNVFNNFYLTVDRWKDQVKVFFLANSVSINNPYFIKWGIDPRAVPEDGFMRLAKGAIVIHFPDSKMFSNAVFQTRFGKFIQDTDEDYAEYAVNNTFHDNHEGLIAFKGSDADYQYSIETKSGTFSVWHDIIKRQYIILERAPKKPIIFTLVPEKMTESKTLMVYGDRPMQNLRTAFRTGRVMFDKPSTRNVFIDIFSR